MELFRYFMVLEYNGSDFHGWQIQPNAITIQEILNHAISMLIKEKINIIGCGRTDTGVHAKKFVAHFDTQKNIENTKQLAFKLNAFLPKKIAILRIVPMPNNAHSRFDATKRTYKYYINTNKDPFDLNFSLQINYNLNIDKMNKAAEMLLKYTDFTSFSKKHTDTKTNNCEIYFAKWKQKNNKIIFTITANRFLRNMVRSIVGTLLEVGKEKITIQDFCEIIEAKNRCKAKLSVVAHALFLYDIEYPYKI